MLYILSRKITTSLVLFVVQKVIHVTGLAVFHNKRLTISRLEHAKRCVTGNLTEEKSSVFDEMSCMADVSSVFVKSPLVKDKVRLG